MVVMSDDHILHGRRFLRSNWELLTESGSVFVQIGDENVHIVRCVMDEVFGSENSAGLIAFSVFLFILIRNHIRFLYLKPFRDKMPGLAANSQYGVMILFLIIFILGLALIIWILKKTAK